MRIQRRTSRLNFRKRRRAGCLPLVVLMGLLVSVAALAATWIEQRFNLNERTNEGDLLAGAEQAFQRGDLDGAIDRARQALARDPDEAEAVVLLARALVYRSYTDYNRVVDRQSALELTTESLSRAQGNPRLLAIHAFVLQANGRPAEAAQMAQRVLDRDPQDGLARVALALAYGVAGSHEIALRESLTAGQNAEWGMDGQRALAISYSDLGDYPNAIRAVEKALKLNNRLAPLYFERALYALQIGDADAATAAYFQVLTYDPTNVKARLRLCELSSLLRERESAVNYCQQVTALAPSWADGWYQLGREYFLQGNFRQAQTALHRCARLQVMQNMPVKERRFECWYLQGQAAEILGDCASLSATYNEFRAMAADASIQQTWTYPPEGPPACTTPTAIRR